MRKKIFAVLMAMLMVIAMSVVALAENDGEFENATGDAVQKSTVTVNLKLKNNLGIAGAKFEIDYDSTVLTPVENDFVKGGDIADLSVVASNKTEEKITLIVLSSDGQTVEGDGTVAKVVFKVSENAPVGEKTYITIKCVESAKANGDAIEDTTIAEGMATLTFTDVTPGDLFIKDGSSDGKVNTLDAMALARHVAGWADYSEDKINISAADVYDNRGDGKVNTLDAMALARHVAGWDEYKTLPYVKG